MNNQISIDYFPDGDMLSITFGEIGRKGQGFELNDHIYIRVDKKTHQPLGLTFLSYSKLIKLGEISLSFWNDFSQEVKHILLNVLQSYPVNLFLNLKKESVDIMPVSSFPDTSIKELIAA
jgi:uncharacterized protein YuzE